MQTEAGLVDKSPGVMNTMWSLVSREEEHDIPIFIHHEMRQESHIYGIYILDLWISLLILMYNSIYFIVSVDFLSINFQFHMHFLHFLIKN